MEVAGSETRAEGAGRPPLPRWLVALALASLPAFSVLYIGGRLHCDETYQWLEPAYFRAFGYGALPWEWTDGVRNWAIPLFFAGLLKASALFGLEHPIGMRAVLAVPHWLLHAAALVAVWRYVERRANASVALWSALAVGLYGPVLLFAGRSMAENYSTAFLLIAFELIDREPKCARESLWGGVMLGLAVVARYPSVVMVGAALFWLASWRQWKPLGWVVLGGGVVALALGALDWATWGKPFASMINYSSFNVWSGAAAERFGSSAPDFYQSTLWRMFPLWVAVALPFTVLTQRVKLTLPIFAGLVYFAAIAITPHKEERFAYPCLVLLVMSAAPGLAVIDRLRARTARWAAVALVVGTSVLPVILFPRWLVFNQELAQDQFDVIRHTARDPATTGLIIICDGVWGCPGYVGIGHRVPFVTPDWPVKTQSLSQALGDPKFNRLVIRTSEPHPLLLKAGFGVRGQEGRWTVLMRSGIPGMRPPDP
ncbi:MAG: glycosyltransferase family protein [Myxococcaceae bacterium]